MTNKKQDQPSIHTGGGAYIGGKVDTGGGDFVGRDKSVSVSVGGNLNGNMVIGDNNTVSSGATNIQNVFAPVYAAIQQAAIPAQEKEDLTAEVREIETAIVKSEPVDEPWLARKLRALKKMAPEIAEVALAALSGPGAAAGAIVKKVAEKVKAEA